MVFFVFLKLSLIWNEMKRKIISQTLSLWIFSIVCIILPHEMYGWVFVIHFGLKGHMITFMTHTIAWCILSMNGADARIFQILVLNDPFFILYKMYTLFTNMFSRFRDKVYCFCYFWNKFEINAVKLNKWKKGPTINQG